MKKVLLGILTLAISATTVAQTDSTQTASKSDKGSFEYTFYVDAYYGYDFNQPYSGERPDFLFNYHEHNSLSINMAMARVGYEKGAFSANLGINTGDFPTQNMAHEKELLRMLYEANASYTFFDKLKLTAGMFSSHVGFESALSFDNHMISHSLVSEWTPYYLGGAKLEYMPNDKWLIGLTVANGNQLLTEQVGNTNKLLGLQVAWSPSEKLTINYSNIYWNDDPDSSTFFKFHNNLWATYDLGEKINLVGGVDYAMGTNDATNQESQLFIGTFIARYAINDQFGVAGRFEHFNDPDNMYISTPLGFGFVTNSYGVNFDYAPMENIKIRLETRIFDNEEPMYRDDTNFDPNTSTTLTYSTQSANVLVAIQAKF